MEKIINGKRYNTKTARKIWVTGYFDADDMRVRWTERLYVKRTGEFFLFKSYYIFIESYGLNEVLPDLETEIRPLTFEGAMSWVARHVPLDDMNKIQPLLALAEGDFVTKSITLPPSLDQSIADLAERFCMTRSGIIREALFEFVNRQAEGGD